MEWSKALDLELALKNVQSDVRGDWYRDPWDWCELSWLVPKHLDDFAIPRLNAAGVKQSASLDVPKENFAIRPAVVLDPLDRLLYQALVDCLSVRLIGKLVRWAYGWRLPHGAPKRGVYAHNDEQWEEFRDHLGRLASYDTAALSTDVVSFFSSIPLDPLCEQILSLVDNEPAARLVDMVSSWYRSTGRGLPQRSAASASLAHMYLAPLDDIVGQFNTIPPGGAALVPEGRALRWMDDIWVFGREQSSLRLAQIAIQDGMRDLALEMNFGKTRVLSGAELVDAVFQLEHSAVDGALRSPEPNEAPLDDLIDRVLAAPETTERTTIRFMTTRMREHDLFDRVPEITAQVSRLPHGADHLARLFRDSGVWADVQDGYVTYAKRWRMRLPWAVSQLATMFPSNKRVAPSLREFFAGALSSAGTPLPLITVAAQRLAAWDPKEARVLIREAARQESHPMTRRSLGLAAIHAGELKSVVRKLLQQNEENALILAMLEDVDFNKKAVPVTADFAG